MFNYKNGQPILVMNLDLAVWLLQCMFTLQKFTYVLEYCIGASFTFSLEEYYGVKNVVTSVLCYIRILCDF